MRICGLQKMTLLDFPGRVACTVFTAGCDLRCPFCHNASLVLPNRLPDELSRDFCMDYFRKRKGLLDGVVISGGEPLLQPGLKDWIREVRAMGYAIKLDTNGCHPDELIELAEAGLLDYVAMDLKNSPERYAETTGCSDSQFLSISRSCEFLLNGTLPYEFRTTVVKGLHTAESLCQAAQWIRGASAYYLQQFTDSGDLIDPSGLSAYSPEEMQTFLSLVQEILPAAQLRGI